MQDSFFPSEFSTVATLRYQFKLDTVLVLLEETNVKSKKAWEISGITKFVRHSRMFVILSHLTEVARQFTLSRV